MDSSLSSPVQNIDKTNVKVTLTPSSNPPPPISPSPPIGPSSFPTMKLGIPTVKILNIMLYFRGMEYIQENILDADNIPVYSASFFNKAIVEFEMGETKYKFSIKYVNNTLDQWQYKINNNNKSAEGKKVDVTFKSTSY